MFPRWLSWIFVGFIAYMLATGYWKPAPHSRAAGGDAAVQSATTQDYPALRALMDGERWKKAIHPTYRLADTPCAALAQANDRLGSYAIVESEGEGQGARCGDTLQVQVQYWNDHGGPLGAVKGHALKLGRQPGLDALLLGLKPGERRTVMLSVPGGGYRTLPELKAGRTALFTVLRLADAP